MNFKVLQKWHQKVNLEENHLHFDCVLIFLVVDVNELQRILNETKGRINSAQTDLDQAKEAPTDASSEDRFVEAMEVGGKKNIQ